MTHHLQGNPMRLKADFSTETSLDSSRKTYSECSKKKTHTRILYPAKLSFKNKGEIKIFPGKQKLTNLAHLLCKKILKKVVYAESK